MATKKPKSRTSKSNLTKKAHVPVWAIVFGLLVLVSLGAFFVYNSFASGQQGVVLGRDVYCSQGNCIVDTASANQHGKLCYPSGNSTNYYCVYGSKPR